MKPHNYIIALILLVFSVSQTISAQSPEEQLVGTWIFDYEASLQSISEKSKDDYPKMDATRQSKVSARYKNSEVTFNMDGTYSQVLLNGRTYLATWIINDDNNLKVIYSKDRVALFMIENIGIDNLELNQIRGRGRAANVLFTDWFFTKK